MRKKCRKSEFASYIIVDDETGVPVMKKDMLKNKRIDEAQLEKVFGGVSLDTSQMDAVATKKYKDFLTNWRLGGFSDLFKNKDFEQSIIESFWDDWRDAGFEPNAITFLRNNKDKIMGCAHSR